MGSRIRENVKHLFECFCEVGPTDTNPEPHVTRIFPENFGSQEILRSIPKFVFPCTFNTVGYSRFSFVLTCADSKWMYGYCRHGSSHLLALVFLSYLPCHDILYKYLEDLAAKKIDIEKSYSENLIVISNEAEYNPNKFHPGFIEVLENYYLTAPPSLEQHQLPCIPGNVNLMEYYSAVNYNGMISMLAALLHERRIIVRSKRPCRISACVQAANDLLYPMVWQHIFIPILPKMLSDYLLAPMPFLIGVPDSVFKTINLEDIGDVVILDADNNLVDSPFDDVNDMPYDVINTLRRTLKTGKQTGDTVPRAFLRSITQLIGGYRAAIKDFDGTLKFDNEAFVASRGSSMKPFLHKLITLQIFQQFIEERMEIMRSGYSRSDEFERECYILEGQSKSISSRTFGAVGNKISSSKFMKQVKDKAHPAMESAVESMRSGSRGVRSAVRGIRNRLETVATVETFKHDHLSLPGPSGFTKVSDYDSVSDVEYRKKNYNEITHRSSIAADPWNSYPLENSNSGTSQNTLQFNNSNKNQTLLIDASPPSPLSPMFSECFINKDVTTTNDLIQLSDSKTNQFSNSDINLLKDYGLDIDKFRISRQNWTTFEE